MAKILKFKAKMKQGSLDANFMGSDSGVEADATYVFTECDPVNTAKSFAFSFDSNGDLLANGSGNNPFTLNVPSAGVANFTPTESGNRAMASESASEAVKAGAGGDEGGLCGCPECEPCN